MHGACRLSRRWHQQFLLSPSFASHQQCLQNFLPIREYRQASRTRVATRPSQFKVDASSRSTVESLSSSPRANIVVREYEPDQNDTNKLSRIEPNEEIVDEMEVTRLGLMQLDKELAIMRQGPFGPQSDFMQSLPTDERQQLLQALEKEGILNGEQEDLLTMAELDRLAEEDHQTPSSSTQRLGVTLRIPRKDQAYIRHFNQALQAAHERNGLGNQQNLNLWKWYLRCQQQVHNFSGIISEEVWKFLWESQAEFKGRPKHLVMLANDILISNQRLKPHQWLMYIKSLHASGDSTTAIQTWQDQKPHLRNDEKLASSFWEVGVKLYSDIGQPMKAQELAFNALSQGKVDAGVLIPVIIAWAKSKDPGAVVKAWACYLKLRESAGVSLLPEVYERLSNAFLDTNHGDMALGVFKDMLLMGETSVGDSKKLYTEATKHFEGMLQDLTTEEQINRVGLSALLILPRQFQNRFFFTSWIKKLIGEKRIDAASMVVELMYERGIPPDAKPLNGIIGAWLREGSPTARQKAESMAWSMVEARAEFVSRRDATSESEGKLYRTVTLQDTDRSVRRRVPSATIETFSILLQYYTRRQDTIQAEKLTNTMIKSCQIKPNSYIMNHWLYSDLRAGRLQIVWDKYCNLKQEIRPDLETFAALWDTAKLQFSKADVPHARSFPSARQLFAELKDWFDGLTPKKATDVREEFSAELFEQIIRCFCLSTDLPGTLLAIHHMANRFNFYPTDNAIRLICGQAARLLPQDGRISGRTTRSRGSLARNKSVMAQVAEVIETLESKKKIAAVDQGADPEAVEDPTTEVAQRLRMAVLTEFMCMFMQKTQSVTGSYLNDVKIAAQTMHVELEGIDLTFADRKA